MSEQNASSANYCSAITSAANELLIHSKVNTIFEVEKVDFEASSKTFAIEILSKGAALEDKLKAEQNLLKSLTPPVNGANVQVYFKSNEKPKNRPLPKTAPRKKTVFGVNQSPQAIPGVKKVIAIASGKGGVGKSTVATNLAVALSSRTNKKVGLLDADIYGPSIPTMLGIKGPVQANATGKMVPAYQHGIKAMSFGFLAEEHEPVVWRGPLVSRGFQQLCFEVDWSDTDILILDLPPGTGDIQLTMIEHLKIDQAIIVTTPQNVALADAYRAQNMFLAMSVPILGVVENMAFYQCPSCNYEDSLFGQGGGEELASNAGLNLIGQIPLNSTIRLAGDSGKPIATQRFRQQAKPFYEIADHIHHHLFKSKPE